MPTDSDPDREVELKLAVPKGAVRGILTHPALLLSAPDARRQRLVSTYYDTPDQTLAHAGVTLRVRQIDGGHVQTVKASRHAGLAVDRAEWEWPLNDDRPDPALLTQTPVADALPSHLDLKPVAVTEIDRMSRTLHLDGGTQIEAAFDAGWIIAGSAREPVHELELELRHGDAATVYRLALQLHETVPVTIETDAKSARGFCLAQGKTPASCKTERVALAPGTRGDDAFRRIIAADLAHLLANRRSTLAGDAEGLHQMRVAIRRLRAALVFFQPCLKRHALARFESELRRVGLVFGEARDWDVFCLDILPRTLVEDAAGWRQMLQAPAQERREAAHRTVAAEIEGPAFTALALELAAWAEQGADAAHPPGDHALHQPLARLCPDLLDRLADKVEQRGRHVDDGTDTERHALRKSMKKLRYAVDYVGGAYPRKAVRSYLHACARLQETLGEFNDAVAAIGLAERLVERQSNLASASAALERVLAARRQESLCELPKRWREFGGEPRFWA